MTEEELLRFAMDIVAKYELNGNGYELVAWTCEPNVFPNIVLKKNGELIFVVVKVAVAPNHATLSNFWKNAYAQKAKRIMARGVYLLPLTLVRVMRSDLTLDWL